VARSPARAARGGEGPDAAQRRAGAAAQQLRGFGSTRRIGSSRGGERRAADLFRGARSSWSTTSCSGPTTRRGVPPARPSRTASTRRLHWRTRTSLFGVCGRRSRSCRRTSVGCGVPWASSFGSDFNATSNISFTEDNSAREASNTTIARAARRRAARSKTVQEWKSRAARARSQRSGMAGTERRHVHARAAGHERVRSRTASSTTPFRLCARAGRLWALPWLDAPPRSQRAGRLVAPPRRVRQALSQLMRTFLGVSALLFVTSAGWCYSIEAANVPMSHECACRFSFPAGDASHRDGRASALVADRIVRFARLVGGRTSFRTDCGFAQLEELRACTRRSCGQARKPAEARAWRRELWSRSETTRVRQREVSSVAYRRHLTAIDRSNSRASFCLLQVLVPKPSLNQP